MSRKYILFALLVALPNDVQAQTASQSPQNDGVVRIAILDTGSKIPEDYPNASVRYFDARPILKTIEETGPDFRSEHGTWVTNAILEQYSDRLEILSYRSEKRCPGEVKCEFDTATLGRAALHAWRSGADIIQISSYGKIDPGLEGILAKIAAQGIHIVMCAGNEGGTSPLIPLARRNPDYIHIVGSLSKSSRRSFFSARDDSRDEPLLRWRLGENVPSRSSNGHLTRVTGTSYAASIMTADLARSLSLTQSVTFAAYKSAGQNAKPAPIVIENAALPKESSTSMIGVPKEDYINTRVALAEGGEIAVALLNAEEKAQLRSRAIKPESNIITTEFKPEKSESATISLPGTPKEDKTSRAIRPEK